MLADTALLLVGLVVLTFASDQFVAGAARLAVRLRLPAVLIGALVIGFGTSAPELVVSGLAAARGLLDFAAGNIIGSNVANLSLVLGTASVVTPVAISDSVLRRELPISTGAVLVYAGALQGGLSRWEGGLLLVGLTAALWWIVRTSRTGDDRLESEVDEVLEDDDGPRLVVEIPRTLLGLGGTVAAAQLLISGATGVADRLGLAEGFVGLTIVAIGTSLPELATAVQAARRRETDLIVGNLLGSNVFNSLAVGGLAGVVGPGQLEDPGLAGLATLLMLGVVLGAATFMLVRRRLGPVEGLLLLGAYVGTLPLLY